MEQVGLKLVYSFGKHEFRKFEVSGSEVQEYGIVTPFIKLTL
jgi:hypothetical protein